jgi:hypothetical protein
VEKTLEPAHFSFEDEAETGKYDYRGLLEGNATHVDVDAALAGLWGGSGRGGAATDDLDDEGGDVEGDEDGGESGGAKTGKNGVLAEWDSRLGSIVVGLQEAGEEDVCVGIDPCEH